MTTFCNSKVEHHCDPTQNIKTIIPKPGKSSPNKYTIQKNCLVVQLKYFFPPYKLGNDPIWNLFNHQLENWVVVSNIFYLHPYLGKIPILTNIFQLGWNHQLAKSPTHPMGCLGCQAGNASMRTNNADNRWSALITSAQVQHLGRNILLSDVI